jgi:2-keto-4-pentenoate hydratase/2-oxohepta-3-ene-1,7-dioic acid hydratase in catechol pathway
VKLVRYQSSDGPTLGVLNGSGATPVGAATLNELLEQPDPEAAVRAAAARDEVAPLGPARLLPPQPAPSKMLFCGINYGSHLEENPGAVLPEEPFFFAKVSSAIVGPGEPIVMPYPDCLLDYEVELAIVIGRRTRHVRAQDALRSVFGYTLVNDVSARDIQFRANQVTLGKNPDSFCPLGPAITLASEMPALDRVQITTHVNGELRQSASGGEMLFGVAELIERLSSLMTLEPGDVVTTGTPAGVACFRRPPAYLRPGDEVVVSADGIGELRNPVVAGW